MSEPYVKTNKNKRYDIFKNTFEQDEVDNIKILLANLAVADTSHDIDKKDKGFHGITNFLRQDTNIHAKMYKKGIPVSYTNVLDEDDAISSVVDQITFKWGPTNSPESSPPTVHEEEFKAESYVPLNVMKYIKEGKIPSNQTLDPNFVRSDGQQHSISTKNKNDYTVTYFDVKPHGNLIDANTFFTNMGYVNMNYTAVNIAFVVDCTSITIEDIFNKGHSLGANFKTYLIKSPEGENDPGGKTNLQDKTFKAYKDIGSGNGVRYRAAVPYNLVKSNSYSYSFKDIQTSPYTQFFTKYNFELSELHFDDKYVFSKLTTNLNIIDPTNSVPLKHVLNSGDANKIGAVSTIIRDIIAKIMKYGNKASAIDTFDYNCALQQKRAGDWLQALLTCLVASGQRKFCEYNSPEFVLGDLFKKKEIGNGASNVALEFKEEDVYLVTHDRILLAFALLLGLNVIFTHHFPGGEHSYHSALVYKITNPLERGQSKMIVMKEFYDGVTIANKFYSQLNTADNRLDDIYKIFTKEVNKFKCGIADCSPPADAAALAQAVSDNLEKYITEFSTLIGKANGEIKNAIKADDINLYTQKIFAMAFKIALIKTTFPDLDNLATDIGAIRNLKSEFSSIKTSLQDDFDNAKNPKVLTANQEDSDYFLQYKNSEKLLYEKIVEYLSKYHAIISKINKLTKINDDKNNFIRNLNSHLKKNPTFGLILAWRTTNVPKCNLWVQYNNVLNPNWAYINDKNIFLYELANLDDDSKDKICTVYYQLFQAIKIPANVAGNASLQAKLQQNVLSFCLEVFVNLGPFVKDAQRGSSIKTEIDKFLAAGPAPEQHNNPNRFNEVIAELNALNALKTENIGSSDEFTKIVVEIPTTNNPSPVTTYEPLLTPIAIEELIEIKVNNRFPSDSEEAKLNKQDVTGANALDRLDVPSDQNLDIQNPTIDLSGIVIPTANLGIADVTFEKVDDEGIGGGQVGGNPKRYQDISFIFNNKMAPRYLAATNLFRMYPDEVSLIYILDRLSGASEVGIDASGMLINIIPPGPANLSDSQTDLNSIGQIGGAHEEINFLLSSEESILLNEKFAPHPLLSIYLILESYCTELDATSIKDSWDYEIFIQFFVIINAMINNLLKIYSAGENNNNTNKLKACMVGYGLRELIFTSPQYIERDPICTEALNIELDNYNPLSKMFSILVNRVCGSVNQTPEDIELGSKYISSPIFKEYATGIEFKKILDSNVGQVNTYELALKSNELFLAVGNKIISDTNGTENNALLELTSVKLPYLIETRVELKEDNNNVAKGLTKWELIKQEPGQQIITPKNNIQPPSDYTDYTDYINKQQSDYINKQQFDYKNKPYMILGNEQPNSMSQGLAAGGISLKNRKKNKNLKTIKNKVKSRKQTIKRKNKKHKYSRRH